MPQLRSWQSWFQFLVGLAFLSALPSNARAGSRNDASATRANEAFATLVYSNEFVLGARVLGQSLREAGTSRDFVALVTESISQPAADTLTQDGWKVHRVGLIANPGTWTQDSSQKFPQRFYGVYTKLVVFNLTQYERVVYLDADTIALRGMDELFRCDGLCAVMRHSERVNTGVMVLTPSAELFQGMMRAIATTPSYTGGDQGFLNSFFMDFPDAPLFDPRKGYRLSESSPWRSAARGETAGMPLGRLPTIYNADLGLYVANSNRWTLPQEEIRVLHFTLAAFKPWDWWAGWIMRDTSKQWQAVRARLPPATDGRAGGRTAQQQLAARLLLPLPLLAAALLAQRWLRQQGLNRIVRTARSSITQAMGAAGLQAGALMQIRHRSVSATSSSNGSPYGTPNVSYGKGELQQLLMDPLAAAAAGLPLALAPAWLTPAAAAAGVAVVAAGLGCSLLLIPRQVTPAVGWTLAYEWTALSIVLLFSLFLQACHRLGRAHAHSGSPSRHPLILVAAPAAMASPGNGSHLGGGTSMQGAAVEGGGTAGNGVGLRPWGATLALFAAILSCLGLLPWWADMLGMQSIAGKAITTAVLGALSGIVCTQCFISLAARWCQCGAAEAALARAVTKLDV